MASGKRIVIICNLDTRGEDIVFVKDLIASRGHEPVLLDFSMEEPPPFPGDITTEEVARRGGLAIEALREKFRTDRDAATANQIAGAAAIVNDLLRENRVHGVIGIGGGTATLVATSVMRQLPFGMPKLMASPMAAHPAYIDKYVGTSDITMHHTVLDIVKMNPLLKAQITNAVGAICGMVELTQGTDIAFDKPCVAISSFGFGEMAVQAAVGMLEDEGFTPIVCHAQGKGDRAMEEMIASGAFHGVVDICTGGIVEHLFHGNRDPGPDRLKAAARAGIPMVLAPCGLDILSYGGRPDMLARTKERAQVVQDALRVQVRTTADELRQAANVIADRLNEARGPWTFLVPLQGWSSLDKPGRPIFDPEADAAFVARLKQKLAQPWRVKELDLHLYTPEFARAAVAEFVRLYEQVHAPRAQAAAA
ncbi:MAG TPA: Tm-1-like ATP-binding domain-containing protein [Ramlibacter sp.]|uniref:Tm-1-like ATP-binding domain-containing protein n=1 Tax=Ramlibacter sp. TaxID=1917967 RepID=UPI002D7F0064|nr:Tm-1-like ATP-binding domain-containing protein [Ramlibacter sp.]HET8748915.1 Tm-1-like ATP-binding domain-containing protein [Ramlibacter sp.]